MWATGGDVFSFVLYIIESSPRNEFKVPVYTPGTKLEKATRRVSSMLMLHVLFRSQENQRQLKRPSNFMLDSNLLWDVLYLHTVEPVLNDTVKTDNL